MAYDDTGLFQTGMQRLPHTQAVKVRGANWKPFPGTLTAPIGFIFDYFFIITKCADDLFNNF